MSDGDENETTAQTPGPRPTPNPASRARRIGGRPTPRPTPKPTPKPSPVRSPEPVADEASARTSTAVDTDDASVDTPGGTAQVPSLTKRSTPKPGKPARAKTKVTPSSRPDDEPEPVPARTDTRALPLRWVPATVLGLAAVTLAVFVGIASHGVYWATQDVSAGAVTSRQEQVLAAAKQCFHDVTSYDYRKLDGLIAKDTACTTGTFKTQLTKSLQTQIIPQAPKAKAVQTAQVNRAGIISVSGDGKQVVVIIYAQLSLSNNTNAKKSQVDVLGAVATMDQVGGKWLISNLDNDVDGTSG